MGIDEAFGFHSLNKFGGVVHTPIEVVSEFGDG
jgi:hypothetical protein